MPCYDGSNDSDYIRSEAARAFTHNSPVAEMLCGVMRLIEGGGSGEWPPGLMEWWAEHQRRDEAKARGTTDFNQRP
jgi:hypothetical protein